ncbi:hypothetical protein FJZ31_01455 [Candidatus Poribacteria bacterium]|nr:hypothetical protein [Candidatus Poribacteria bacterium]
MIQKACEALQVQEKHLAPFETEDNFNNNILRGFLCRVGDHRYGAIYLTHINDIEEPQLIYATPKLHYPFDSAGTYRFPPAKRVEVYEKLDGTNILAYRYNCKGQTYLTYKLRLTAVVRNSRFGPFLDFWREMLKRYPDIPRLPEINDCNISFELYGALNKHLILYKVPLDTAVLFGVDNKAEIIPPNMLNTLGVPIAPLYARLEGAKDYQREYQKNQADCEAMNRTTEDGTIEGTEGRVWYLQDIRNHIVMFKCKPESVEQIHWAAGGLSKNAVIATAYNLLETDEHLAYDKLKELLLEEYSEDAIERFRPHIEAVIHQITEEMRFKEKILEFYYKLDLDFQRDKNAVMRAFSQQYPKGLMRRIYSILSQELGKTQ